LEIRDRANGLLDRDVGIQAAGAIAVDVLQAETGQGVTEIPHGERPSIDAEPAAVQAAQRAELYRDQRLVAPVPQPWIVAIFSASSAGP